MAKANEALGFWREVDKRLASTGRRRPWLAEETEIPLGRINNWVNRLTMPRFNEGVRIATALHVSPRTLLTGKEENGTQDLPPDLREIVEIYRVLPDKDRITVKYICRAVFRLIEAGYLSVPVNTQIDPTQFGQKKLD